MLTTELQPGMRVRIRQVVDSPSHRAWRTATSGVVVDIYTEWQSPLANAFAGSESGEYPLARITLRKDNGSLSDFVLDERTEIDVLS